MWKLLPAVLGLLFPLAVLAGNPVENSYGVTGSTSGQVTVRALTGTYNFNLPATAGSSGSPLLSGGGGSTAMTWGSRSGSTTVFATSTGALVAGHCVSVDASGNFQDSGAACLTAGSAPVTSVATRTGAVTLSFTDLSGVATVAQGGTGLSSYAADQVPLATASTTLVAASLPNCTDATGSHLNYSTSTHTFSCGTSSSGGSGSVTSVGLSLPSDFTVSGSPVTGSGTLTATRTTQTANTVMAGPTTGTAAAPTYRALVAADLPTSGVTAATYGDATHVGQFTVNAQGEVTSASSVTITGAAPTGSASGDLSDTYPGPTVAKVNGTSVPTNSAADQVPVTTASATAAWKSVPDCSDTSGNHLNYAVSSHAFSCGTTSGSSSISLTSYTVGGSNTWTKPAGVNVVCVKLFGAGSSGGGGAGGATSTVRFGGSGGGGGAVADRCFRASDITSTVTVTVGSGGTSVTGGSTAVGTDGVAGGNTSFGSYLVAYHGGTGKGGQIAATGISGGGGGGTAGAGSNGGTTATTGGSPASASNAAGISGQGAGSGTATSGLFAEYGGGAGGGTASGGTGFVAGGSLYAAGGGAGGGGGTSANSIINGSAGGAAQSYVTGTGAGGGASGVAGTAGNAGDSTKGGGGGGSGGGNLSGTGGAGGAGGVCGGGGGGGGGGTSTGGASGAGGDGCAFVWAY